MKLAYYIGGESLGRDPRVEKFLDSLTSSGFSLCEVRPGGGFESGADALMSLGGDGTFLSAARLAVTAGIPMFGVNFGRMGFLSEHNPEDVADALRNGEYIVEDRELLKVAVDGAEVPDFWPYALNETTLFRMSASMLGVDVSIDGEPLPTFWSDGLLVATSSGSTAYSLSVGGPVCMPDAGVHVVAPISPHNLNVRPLIVPGRSVISMTLQSRDAAAVFTMDNLNYTISADSRIEVSSAPQSLKRIRPVRSNFFDALRSRLFWGEDVRNTPKSK